MQQEPPGLPADFHTRLVTDCPDAIIFADSDGLIRCWNRAATRMFGFVEEEALGASLDLIIPERLRPLRPRHWQGYHEVMGGRQSRYAEGALLAVPARYKNGRQVSVEFTILPFHDGGGKLVGIAAVMRDVTARFEEVRALRRELAVLKGQPAGR